MQTDDDPFEEYTVVINHEEQYSIWPTARALPPGWTEVGTRGPKAACLDHIEKVWTDMRPLSLRQAMAAAAAQPPVAAPEPAETGEPPPSLPSRLAATPQPIEVALRPDRTAGALRACLERGFVKLRFTETKGGAEIGFKLDPQQTEMRGCDFEKGEGELSFRGRARVDFVPIECAAKVSLTTLSGSASVVLSA